MQRFLPLLCRIGGLYRPQPAIKFALNQIRILQQTDHLGPYDVVEEILTNWTDVAYRSAEVPPSIGAEASVVVDVARGRARRRMRQRIAAFAARHQALHNAGRDRATRPELLVLRQQLLGSSEGVLINDCRNRDLDQVGARPFVVGAIALADAAAQA